MEFNFCVFVLILICIWITGFWLRFGIWIIVVVELRKMIFDTILFKDGFMFWFFVFGGNLLEFFTCIWFWEFGLVLFELNFYNLLQFVTHVDFWDFFEFLA